MAPVECRYPTQGRAKVTFKCMGLTVKDIAIVQESDGSQNFYDLRTRAGIGSLMANIGAAIDQTSGVSCDHITFRFQPTATIRGRKPTQVDALPRCRGVTLRHSAPGLQGVGGGGSLGGSMHNS